MLFIDRECAWLYTDWHYDKVREPKGMQHMGADIRVIKNMVGEIGATISRASSSLKSVLLTF